MPYWLWAELAYSKRLRSDGTALAFDRYRGMKVPQFPDEPDDGVPPVLVAIGAIAAAGVPVLVALIAFG